MRERGGGRDRQSRDDGQDRRESDGGDDAQQDGPAQHGRQQRGRGVHTAGRVHDRLRAHHRGGAEAQHQGEEVEDADEPDRPDDGPAGLFRGGHRVEAHEHVRQSGGAQHQGQGQRHEVDGQLSVLESGCQQRVRRIGDRVGHGVVQDVGEVEAVLPQHQDRHDEDAAYQQERLDDLDPRGALHAAHQHVDDHDDTHDRDDERLADPGVDTQQQGHEAACAGHLGQQVEEAHGQCRERRGHADGTLLEAERQHVRHRELRRVAHELCY